jgi:hypothetical protein
MTSEAMPEVVRLSNCKICVYSGDHAPPHFHVRGPGWNVVISMGSLVVLKGKGPRADIAEAIAWEQRTSSAVRVEKAQ